MEIAAIDGEQTARIVQESKARRNKGRGKRRKWRGKNRSAFSGGRRCICVHNVPYMLMMKRMAKGMEKKSVISHRKSESVRASNRHRDVMSYASTITNDQFIFH